MPALTDNLLAYWKLDEASGTTAFDSVGSNDLIDTSGAVGTATGLINSARDFAPTNNLSLADTADLSGGDTDFTIQAWVKADSLSANRAILSKWGGSSATREYLLFYNASTSRWNFQVQSATVTGTVVANNAGAASTGTWYLIHAWHDSVNDQIGIAVNAGTANTASHTTGINDSATTFYLGTNGATGNPWDGLVDEAGFWRRVLTSAERTQLYNAGSGLAFDNFASAGDAITTTDPTQNRIYQRAPGSTSKTVAFAGGYTGTDPTTIQVKIVKASDSALVQDWTALSSASITGGGWSGDLSVPQGGWYHFLARSVDSDGSTVLATSMENAVEWGVGINILTAGQSNMRKMFDQTSGAAASHDLTRRYNGSWGAVVGTGAIRLANQIRAGLAGTGEAGTDIPIGLLDYAVSGSGLHADNGSGYWMDTTAGSPYKLAQAAVQAVDCEFVLWHQGEASAILNDGKTAYKTDLGTLYSRFQTDTGRTTSQLKLGCALLGNINDTTATDATTDPIRQAQLEFIRDTTGAFFAGSSVDMVRSDNYHWSATNEPYYARMGSRYARAVLKQLGEETNGAEGPKIASASRDSGSADITLTITQNGGTAIEEADGTTDGGSLTGFQVSDDDFSTTLTISSTAFSSGSIVLTLSAAPADSDTIKVRYQYGENPSITNVVYDDQTPQSDTLGLPLQPTIGSVTASLNSAAATTYTLEGPSSGTVNEASTDFTVTPDAAVSADVVVTPSDGGAGGTFTPASVTFTSGTSTAQTFTYTPTAAGAATISTTNDGGLTNPDALTYTASEAPVPTADAYTLSGPDSGLVDVASGAFTVRSNGTLAADVTITPSDGADGGTFTPSTVTLAAGDFTEATFTYTPASTGAKTISVTNDGSLTDPGDRTFNAVDTLGGFFPVLARRRGRR